MMCVFNHEAYIDESLIKKNGDGFLVCILTIYMKIDIRKKFTV